MNHLADFILFPLQINIDEDCGDESEEKNPYPANDYIGNTQTGCVYSVRERQRMTGTIIVTVVSPSNTKLIEDSFSVVWFLLTAEIRDK